jgi:alanine racemase
LTALSTKEGILRPLEATVDLARIRNNVRFLKNLTPPGCAFMAVVKDNAYGHGDVAVSRAALDAGADCLGVALVEEGLKLRAYGFECPIYVLFEPPPSAARAVVEKDLVCGVYSVELARALSDAATAMGGKARVHIKVDTGMHRVGVYPREVGGLASTLGGLAGLEVEGIYTHLAMASEPTHPFNLRQLDIFEESADEAERVLGRSLLRHAAASGAIMAIPRSHYDMVRAGIAVYGLPPSEAFADVTELKPALSLAGRVAHVKKVPAGEGVSYGLTFAPERDTWIATLPLGYGDGFSRMLTGKADVLIGGVRRPVVGVICMDLCMVDLGPEPVPKGVPFAIIGGQGNEEITADELASKLGTINYEVVCMISQRVPRVYTDDD